MDRPDRKKFRYLYLETLSAEVERMTDNQLNKYTSELVYFMIDRMQKTPWDTFFWLVIALEEASKNARANVKLMDDRENTGWNVPDKNES